jgi:hypothetical protein
MRPMEVTHMRTKWVLAFALVFGLSAMPAMAGHRHGRGCGHVYSRARHGWIAVDVASRNFGFSYRSAPRYDAYGGGRYYGDRYYGDRYYGDPYGGYGGGYWDPYRYDSRYDKHRGYWKKHWGHRHNYHDRCR